MVSVLTAAAQDNIGNVKGKIKSSAGEELINAVIVFRSINDTAKAFPSVCDAHGSFRQELPKGEYSFTVYYLDDSYSIENNKVLIDKPNVEIPDIVIFLREKVLDEASVVAEAPFVSYNGNTARYNLSANPAAVGGNLLDGLKLIPGVQEDESSGLSVFGFYKLRVAVNGQLLRLTDEEIQTYLSSLSVTDVEAVELIRYPGPEYDTNGDGVLNIITNKKPNEGFNGFASADLIYRKFFSENARARINYNKENWRNYVSYQFFDRRRKQTLTTNIGADSTETKPYRGHTLQAGSEWQMSPKQMLGARLLATLSDQTINYNHTNSIEMDRKVGTANLYHTLSSNKLTWKNYADYTYSENRRDYFYGGTAGGSLKDKYNYFRVASDLIYRIMPEFMVWFGGRQNMTWFETRSLKSANSLVDDHDESNTSAYISLRYIKDKVNVYGGIQYNYDRRKSSTRDSLEVTDNISNWQPYCRFTYDLGDHRLSAALQTYYSRPSLRDLMPYASYSGFLYRLGNPDLKNSSRYNLSLSYFYLRAAMLEVDLSNERHPIVEHLTPYNDGYALIKTNLDHSRYLRLIAGSPIPIINKDNGFQWIANLYLAYHLQHDKGVLNSQEYKKTFHAYYIQHKQSLYLPSRWYFDAQVTYYSPLYAGVYKTKAQWWTNFTISKRIQNWKLSVSGYDIFNTNVAKGKIVGMSDPVHFKLNWHSPRITFSVSLNFGNRNLKTSNHTNIDSESRLSKDANEGISINQQ
jgi:hypothetical protein